jgi:hydroxypyruvate reductase
VIHNHDELANTSAKRTALACLTAGIDAARPERAVRRAVDVSAETLTAEGTDGPTTNLDQTVRSTTNLDQTVHLDLGDYDRVLVVGGGKAAAGLARELTALLADAGHAPDGGTVLVPSEATEQRHDTEPTHGIELAAGGHPTPTASGVAATRRALAALDDAGPETLVLAPITGGGSALLTAPRDDISLGAVQSVTRELLDAGAEIAAVNTVRKQLSAVKGGRLAARAVPATVLGLLVSDVVGDDPSVVASGPTVPDDSTPADALAVLEEYSVDAPEIREALTERTAETANGRDTANPRDNVYNLLLASAETPLDAARRTATERGYDARVVSPSVTGEARERGRTAAALGATVADCAAETAATPTVLLSGGETTVTVSGDGHGGPNCEYALAAASELARRGQEATVAVAAVDTDGCDGSTDVAGAVVDATTITSEAATRALAENDSLPCLTAHDAAIKTGATGTNVNDLRVIVVDSG